MSIFNISFPVNLQPADKSSKPSNMKSDFTSTAKDSSPKETIAYICGLRARIECEPISEHSTHSDRVTNIGYYFFWGAVFGCNCRNKIRINVGGFEDSPAGCGFPKN